MKGGEFILFQDKPSDVFTSADFSDDQKLIQETIRDFVNQKLLTDTAIQEIESKNFSFTKKLLLELGQLGFLGIDISTKYGGSELDKITSCIVTEEIAKQGSFGCSFGAHAGIGSWPIIFFGTEQQKEKYLPRLASGKLISCYSLTEAGSGSDAGAARTKAAYLPSERSYILSGEKIFVTNGGFADIFIVFAQVPDAGLTAFIVEKNFAGVIVGKEEEKMGIHGSSTATIILDNVRVSEENKLGEAGKGLKIALNILNLGRFKLGAGCLGAARLCLQKALEYSKQREQFGKPIREFGLIKEKLAQMAAKIFAMDAIVYRTARFLEESVSKVDTKDSEAMLRAIGEYAIECSIVKVFCSEKLGQIADQEVQILGGYGFCEEYPAARHFRDARINRIFEGTNEINRLVILQMLVKKALSGKLPLLPAIKKVRDELIGLMAMPENADVTSQYLFHLNNAKKAVLLASGANLNKYSTELEKHQLIIGTISDCLVDVFVLDSVLASFAKKPSEEKGLYLQLLYADMLPVLKTRIENLFACCMEGDELRVALSALKKLFKMSPLNTEILIEKIADKL